MREKLDCCRRALREAIPIVSWTYENSANDRRNPRTCIHAYACVEYVFAVGTTIGYGYFTDGRISVQVVGLDLENVPIWLSRHAGRCLGLAMHEGVVLYWTCLQAVRTIITLVIVITIIIMVIIMTMTEWWVKEHSFKDVHWSISAIGVLHTYCCHPRVHRLVRSNRRK